MSDSSKIVRYLDATYPSSGPTLLPAELDALHRAFDAAFMATTFGGGHLAPLVLPAGCAAMNPRSAEYFRRTREVMFGPLEAMAPAGSEKRAEHLTGCAKAFGETIAGWLGKTPDGKERLFFMGGDKLCYADVTIAGFFKCLTKALPPDELKVLMSSDNGRWERFMAAFKPYEAEDAGSLVEL